MTRTRHLRSTACLALLFSSVSLYARADEAEATARIGIRVIYAVRDKTQSIDPALKDIEGELRDLPFSKFRLLDKLEADVGTKSAVELQFPGARSIAVRFLGLESAGDKPMLGLQLAIPPKLKLQLRLADGGRTLLVGPTHLEGLLILDVSARLQPAKEKP